MNTLPKPLSKFIWHFIAQYKGWFFIMVFSHLAWSIDQTVVPYAFKIFIDQVTNFTGNKLESWNVIAFPVLLILSLWILTDIMYRIHEYTATKFNPAIEATIRMSMLEYVQGHSHKYFANNFAGNIANKISDMPESITRIIFMSTALFIPTIFALMIGVGIFASMHPFFASIMAVWFAIHIGICLKFAGRCSEYSFTYSQSASHLTGKIVDSLSNIINIKSFAKEEFELKNTGKFQKIEEDNHRNLIRFIFKIRLSQSIICFLMMGALMMYFMVTFWQKELITTAELVYIFYTSWGLTVMAWIAGGELPNLFRELGTCRQAIQLIKEDHEITDIKSAKKIKVTKGDIKFNDVTFNYTENNQLFTNKNAHIKGGQKVGLVGLSGSGKTTFVNLILRFFNVDSGTITIDGQDISKVTRKSLREQIAMIPQDPTLFHRSIRENIAYANPKATDAEIVAAAQAANATDFIDLLPKKYDTMVGERGIKLSGGQRQRIAIARAILKNAPIIILDEATSALDSITEQQIKEGLDSLMKNHTAIVIAHRLSTLDQMDRILVFDQGSIIEDGTHKELLAKKGHYHKMWQCQAGGFLPEK